jgi:hypothetical protein
MLFLRLEAAMGNTHTPADDIFYDLVSIQYHALKGAQVYDQYMVDAKEHDDVREFIGRVKTEDNRRAEEAHKFLSQLAGERQGSMKR